jgi:hypothetical protein
MSTKGGSSVSRDIHDKKTELFWALMELKERLWIALTVWGKLDNVSRNTTLRLMEQALDLVQYRESLHLAELRNVLDELAAAAPDSRLNSEIAAVKQMTLRLDEDGSAASLH